MLRMQGSLLAYDLPASQQSAPVSRHGRMLSLTYSRAVHERTMVSEHFSTPKYWCPADPTCIPVVPVAALGAQGIQELKHRQPTLAYTQVDFQCSVRLLLTNSSSCTLEPILFAAAPQGMVVQPSSRSVSIVH